MMIRPKSYPFYRPLFGFAPWLKTWSLGFFCIPDGATLSFSAKWDKIMELVVEREDGMGLVIQRQGREIAGTTVQLVSKSESEPNSTPSFGQIPAQTPLREEDERSDKNV